MGLELLAKCNAVGAAVDATLLSVMLLLRGESIRSISHVVIAHFADFSSRRNTFSALRTAIRNLALALEPTPFTFGTVPDFRGCGDYHGQILPKIMGEVYPVRITC